MEDVPYFSGDCWEGLLLRAKSGTHISLQRNLAFAGGPVTAVKLFESCAGVTG